MKKLCWLFITVALFACKSSTKKYTTWEFYGGSKQGIRYSGLKEIDTLNVSQLQIAWTYHTGDSDKTTQIQVNPIIIDGILYGVSPKLKLFALDAATGKEKWVFDPVDTSTGETKGRSFFSMNVCRGVTFYAGAKDDQRLFFGASSKLFCIDANNGKPVQSFGDNGKIDLHNDLERDVKDLYIASTSPGIIYKDMIIVSISFNPFPAFQDICSKAIILSSKANDFNDECLNTCGGSIGVSTISPFRSSWIGFGPGRSLIDNCPIHSCWNLFVWTNSTGTRETE